MSRFFVFKTFVGEIEEEENKADQVVIERPSEPGFLLWFILSDSAFDGRNLSDSFPDPCHSNLKTTIKSKRRKVHPGF
jgi:hypothetical protein